MFTSLFFALILLLFFSPLLPPGFVAGLGTHSVIPRPAARASLPCRMVREASKEQYTLHPRLPILSKYLKVPKVRYLPYYFISPPPPCFLLPLNTPGHYLKVTDPTCLPPRASKRRDNVFLFPPPGIPTSPHACRVSSSPQRHTLAIPVANEPDHCAISTQDRPRTNRPNTCDLALRSGDCSFLAAASRTHLTNTAARPCCLPTRQTTYRGYCPVIPTLARCLLIRQLLLFL